MLLTGSCHQSARTEDQQREYDFDRHIHVHLELQTSHIIRSEPALGFYWIQ